MSNVEIIRELPPSESGANRLLIRWDAGDGPQCHVISTLSLSYGRRDTLLFETDEDGSVLDFGADPIRLWGKTREEQLAELEGL